MHKQEAGMEQTERRRQRHLIDFDNPRPRPAASSSQGMSMTQVQRWVASMLAFVTVEHLAFGIAIAAIFTDAKFGPARVGLNVLAAVSGVLGVVLCRAIHGKGPFSVWLLVGVIPGLVGAYFCFWR